MNSYKLVNKFRRNLNEDTYDHYTEDYQEFKEKLKRKFMLKHDEKFSEGFDREEHPSFISSTMLFAREYFEQIGEGWSRRVLQMDDGRILKLPTRAMGFRENARELKLSHSEFSPVIPKVEEVAPDYLWIVMEKVKVIDSVEESFEFFPGVPGENIDEKYENWSLYLYAATLFYSMPGPTVKEAYKKFESVEAEKIQEKSMEEKVQIVEGAANDLRKLDHLPVLVKLILKHSPSIAEWRPGNIGVNGDGDFVLIDPSIGSDTSSPFHFLSEEILREHQGIDGEKMII